MRDCISASIFRYILWTQYEKPIFDENGLSNVNNFPYM